MRFSNYIQEEYVGLGVTRHAWSHIGTDKSFTIFKNPSAKEIRESGDKANFVRYFVDFDDNDLYIWPGNVMHIDAFENLKRLDKLDFSGNDYDWFEGAGLDRFSTGVAKISGGKLAFYESDTGESYINLDASWLNNDDKWLNRWFTKPYIKTFKEDYAPYLNEGYVQLAKGYDRKDYPIFKNPTTKELRSINHVNGIRFIVDEKEESIYCFDGDALHSDAYKTLKMSQGDLRYWNGVGYLVKNKIQGLLISDYDLKIRPWLSKYLSPGLAG